jgi:hypothetical protein
MSAAIIALQAHLDAGNVTEEELMNCARTYASRKQLKDAQMLVESVAKGDLTTVEVDALVAKANAARASREAAEQEEPK